ncbi:MAG TPA: adenylyltransferase/cytidyltransferase family protein [Chitinophagaceae bacterium]|nr:adenylyltransferase/cytidyltransferase family protein [Chitinophagaceae bacterium]
MDKLQLIRSKILSLEDLKRRLLSWRLTGKRVVFTNGCFDLLHRGHIELLLKAAGFGQILVVGLNSDASVALLKGPGRPLNAALDRALTLASMEFVDAVTIFGEQDPALLIGAILPDVLVKGNDYRIDEIAGAETVLAHGGSVQLIPLVEGLSSTSILNRMAQPEGKSPGKAG